MELSFRGESYELAEGESVLECLLRSGHEIPNGCRSGACRSCLMKHLDGALPPAAQSGLRPTAREAGLFYACQARPKAALSVEEVAAPKAFEMKLIEREELAPSTYRLRFDAPEKPRYRGGQFLSLKRPDGLARSYSLASLHDEDFLEFHVRLVPEGRMSGYLSSDLEIGDTLTAEGPMGDCVYDPAQLDRPLILIGAGTGLAPLWAVARDALRAGHRAPIELIQAGLRPERLYLVEELRELSREYEQLQTRFCVMEDPEGIGGEDCDQADLYSYLRERFPEPRGQGIYLCGDPQMVLKLRREFFLSGAAMDDIYGDPFSPTVTTIGR